jgi:hypothetical protein
MKLKKSQIKEFPDEKDDLYNLPSFIERDPISIPHRYSKKEDIEISGFLAATIAWGKDSRYKVWIPQTLDVKLLNGND